MIRFEVPIKTIVAANHREHHFARARRVKKERAAAHLCTKAIGDLGKSRPNVIMLTRFGSRQIDSDGIPSALKAVRDGIASALGIDDGDARTQWIYQQAKCKRGKETVFVEMT